jgi:ribosomal protein S18 acetylase RimI-like enzyme
MFMIRLLDLANLSEAQTLLNVQRASYAIEAELIGFAEIPPLVESLEALQACGEIIYGYFVEDELAGAIGYKIENNTLDIHRLMVHPAFFRRGIAGKLLDFIEAQNPHVPTLIVATGAQNDPAVALYQRHGFVLGNEQAVAPGLMIVHLRKERTGS